VKIYITVAIVAEMIVVVLTVGVVIVVKTAKMMKILVYTPRTN